MKLRINNMPALKSLRLKSQENLNILGVAPFGTIMYNYSEQQNHNMKG